MADIPAKPNIGQPVQPVLGDAAFISNLMDLVAAWRNGELGRNIPGPGANRRLTPIAVPESGNLDPGVIQQLTDLLDSQNNDAAYRELLRAHPTFTAKDAVWHSEIATAALTHVPILAETQGQVRSRRYVAAEVSEWEEDKYFYAMIDPADPTKLKAADAGIYKILGHFEDDYCILDTQESQDVWLYELTEDSGAIGDFDVEVAAKLLRLDGTVFADETTGTKITFGKHLTSDPVTAGSQGVCKYGGNKFYAVTPPAVESTPRCRFHTASKISQRIVDATIDLVEGGAINCNTGNLFTRGDSIRVHDPDNLWGEIEANATGTAYWRTEPPQAETCSGNCTWQWSESEQKWSLLSNDCDCASGCGCGGGPTSPGTIDGETAQIPCEFIGRWEIETCTLPIDEVLAKLDDCLLNTTFNATATVGGDPVDWNWGTYPNVDVPPEFGTGPPYSVNFENPEGLDSKFEGYIRLRRTTDKKVSEPRNLEVPKEGSATTAKWTVVAVDEQIARWSKWAKNSSTWDLVTFWEGADPTECGAFAECAFDCSCMQDGDEAIGFYAPEDNKVYLISSDSALLGGGKDLTIIGSDSPGNLPYFGCNEEDGTYDLKYSTTTAKVFCSTDLTEKSAPINSSIFECLDLCSYICLYCDEFSNNPDICYPCRGQCVWTWESGQTQDWVLTDECEGGEPNECGCYEKPTDPEPGPGDPQTITLPCGPLPDPHDCCYECDIVDTDVQFNGVYNTVDGPILIETTGPSVNVAYCTWRVPGQGDGGSGLDPHLTIDIQYHGAGRWTVSTLYDNEIYAWDGVIENAPCWGGEIPSVSPGAGQPGYVHAGANPNDCPTYVCCEDCEFPDDPNQFLLSVDITSLEGGVTYTYTLDTIGQTNSCEWQLNLRKNPGDQPYGSINLKYSATGWDLTTLPGGGQGGQDYFIFQGSPGTCDGLIPANMNNSEGNPFGGGITVEGRPCAGALLVGQSIPTPAQPATSQRLGDMFAAANPDLFKGCGCKKDVVAVMNRWTQGRVTDRQIENAAKPIARKTSHKSQQEIEALIRVVVS